MSLSVLDVFLASVESVAAVATVFSIGVALAWRGVLDQNLLRGIGQLAFKIFMPCITFTSVAGGMSVDYLQRNVGLLLAGIAICLAGASMGFLALPFARAPKAFRAWFVVACAFPNMIAIPLVIVEAICRGEEPTMGEQESCIYEAQVRLFTFVIFFPFLLYGPGSIFIQCSTAQAAQTEADASASPRPVLLGVVSDKPAEDAQSTEAAKPELEAEAAASVVDAAQSAGAASVETANSQDLSEPSPPATQAAQVGSCRWMLNAMLINNPPVLACIVSLFIALVPGLQPLFFGPTAPLKFFTNSVALIGKCTPAIMSIVMAGSLGLQLKKLARFTDVFGGEHAGISRWTLISLVITKMIIMPCVIFLCIFLVQDRLPEDRWYRLVMYIEAVGPTANNVVLLATILGKPEVAQVLALTSVSQLFVFLPVATFFTFMGLSMTDHLRP